MRCYAVDLAQWQPSQELYERLLSILGEIASERIRKFRHKKDAYRTMLGRLLPLWEVCGSNNHCWMALRQDKTAKGRPFLVSGSDGTSLNYDFNISHDGDWVVMGSHLSNEPVSLKIGVDVMRLGFPTGIPDIPAFEETVTDLLHNEECEQLLYTPMDDKLELLLHYWTSKEAVSKALGDGLSFPYNQLDTSDLRERHTMQVQGQTCPVKEFTVQSKGAEYMVVLAVLADEKIRLQEVKLEQVAVDTLVDEVLAFQKE